MVEAATTQVKAFDPSIRLLSNDDMWITHHRYLDAGLPSRLDGFALHPYVPHGPERGGAIDAEWLKPYRIGDEERSFASFVRRLREHGLEKLGHVPEIWLTEWGWPVGSASPRFVSEATQAARLPRAFIVAEAAGVQAQCWYSSHDAGEDFFGLVGRGSRRRPAFDTFKTLSRELGAAALLAQVIGRDHATTGLQGFVFDDGHEHVLALWNADEVDLRVRLDGPLHQARGVDGYGQVLNLADGTLTVGACPV